MIDARHATLAESLPAGRNILRTINGYTVQPLASNYWVDCDTVEEARRVALGFAGVVDLIEMIERVKSNGVDPETGAHLEQIHQVLADMANGLVGADAAEMAKAAVCRCEGIEAG